MNIQKIKSSRTFLLALVFTLTVMLLTSMTYAESKYQIAEQHKVWMIGEYEDGIPIFIPVGADCVVNYSVDFNRYSGYNSLYEHMAFVCAKNWSGEPMGYDLNVYEGTLNYYDTNNNYLKNINLDQNETNVLVSQDWIWICKYSNSIYNIGGTDVKGKTYGAFYCPSAFSSWTQTVNVELVIPY